MAVAYSASLWGFGILKRQRLGGVARERRLRNFFSVLLVTFCLVGLALLHVWSRLQVVRLGYILSTTTKLQSRLEQKNRELQLELATLTSPDRVERLARLHLGLREPKKGQVVILP